MILSATRSLPLQVRNSNLDDAQDGASESQNCFDDHKLLTSSSCFEMVNKQDSVIESRLSDYTVPLNGNTSLARITSSSNRIHSIT